MPSSVWQSLNDLTTMLSARPVALPLIILLIAKIYSLAPTSLFYVLGLMLLTGLFAVRWGFYLVARQKYAFAQIYKEQQVKSQQEKKEDQ